MSAEHFWLENLIVLGQGAPNRIRKIGGQQGRCVCAWSEELGFCRLYPLPYGYVHDWDIIDVDVRLPSQDGRKNTFVIYNYEDEWQDLRKRICIHGHRGRSGKWVHEKLPKGERIRLVERLSKGQSFSKIRDAGESFGIIEPERMEFFLKQNRKSAAMQHRITSFVKDLGMLDDVIMDQKDFAWIPYIQYWCKYECSAAHPHEQKIVEWGAYRFMMKGDPSDREYCEKLKDNYHIGDPSYKYYLLIGNIKKYPRTYIVVKVIRFKLPDR